MTPTPLQRGQRSSGQGKTTHTGEVTGSGALTVDRTRHLRQIVGNRRDR